jgi:hypothetical protein
MLRLLIVLGAVVSVMGCASRPSEQAAAPTPTTEQDEGRGAHHHNFGDEQVDTIGELELPAAACALATERWNGTESITALRLSAGGPVFALVIGPRARLHLPVGPSSAGAGIEIEDGGISLRGFLSGDAFALHPGKPLILGGYAIPTAFADLSYTEAREGQVAITYEIGPGVEGEPLGASVPCSDLTVDFAGFEATAALGDVSKAKDQQLRVGHAIELRAQPGGNVVARLHAKDDDDSVVQVLQTSGRSKRILWWRNTAVVFGWVAASEIRPLSVALLGYGTGRGSPLLPRSAAILEVLRCDRDTPLFAEAGGQRAKVGSVKGGTALEVLSREGDSWSVQPQSKRIAAAPPARLFASAFDLARCAPAR